MSRRSSRGIAPMFLLLGSLVSFFVDLVAYCVAGWWGVLVAVVVVGLIVWAVASEIQGSAERAARADEEWVRYYVANTVAPQRRPRRTRGGAR